MNWFSLILDCEHMVYVRLENDAIEPESGWVAQCPRCASNYRREHNSKPMPISWKVIRSVGEEDDDTVSNVSSGYAFLMSRNIMRIDGKRPLFPYRGNR